MTTTPNALVETVSHERMPVLLVGDEAQDQWMAGSDADAFDLCKSYPPERMRLVKPGFKKRDIVPPDDLAAAG